MPPCGVLRKSSCLTPSLCSIHTDADALLYLTVKSPSVGGEKRQTENTGHLGWNLLSVLSAFMFVCCTATSHNQPQSCYDLNQTFRKALGDLKIPDK